MMYRIIFFLLCEQIYIDRRISIVVEKKNFNWFFFHRQGYSHPQENILLVFLLIQCLSLKQVF